jgi:iron complex transport system substrate-binding protein
VDRIGCLYSFAGHAVALLGWGPKVVAVSRGLKRDSLLLEICPAIGDARVPKSQGGLNIEELLKARPDIVFLSSDVGRDAGETDKLDSVGIPYLVVEYANISQQQQAVAMIAQALDCTEKASAYIRYYNECVKRVRDIVSTLPETEILRVYHSVNEANRTAIPRSLSTGWLDVLGVVNVVETEAPGAAEGKQTVSIEQILLWNPDVILVNEPATQKQMLTDRPWTSLGAVRSQRVFLLPVALSRWGHPGSIETPLAILWAARKLYPDHFGNLDMIDETRWFYERFFNYRLSDDLIRQIFDGRFERLPKNSNGAKRR